MAWSTRQLAELAGVTLRSIRHWHEIGLLPEPERLTNGYKQYSAKHLVLALRVTRLTGLGFSLGQVTDMLDSEAHGIESLHGLRAELDSRITELTRVRSDIDGLITRGVAPDLSPGALMAMDAIGADPASRNIAILLARLLPEADMPAFANTMRNASDALAQLNSELLALPTDTSEDQVAALVERGVTLISEFLTVQGNVIPGFDPRIKEHEGADAMTELMNEHMNPAQQRVMNLIVEQLVSHEHP